MTSSFHSHSLSLPLLLIYISGLVLQTLGLGLGINYGRIANNLPPPSQVLQLVQSMSISKVKLYDADPNVLRAFSNSSVEFIVSVSNQNIQNMVDPTKALAWIKENIQPYLPQTKIICITVGNEVFAGNDPTQISNLLPAMQTLHGALTSLGLNNQVNISTAHSFEVLAESFPPSSGSFRPDLAVYIQPLLNFLTQVKSPFLINAYPFFAYKGNPSKVQLDYVLFQPNSGMTDPITNLKYDNMLYAQIDAVHSAIKAMGHNDIDVQISETGWPSKGDSDEIGATVEYAGIYHRNLLQRIAENQGTPMRPSVPVDIFVFALFNENMKPGPSSERNFGLLYPDGTPVYDLGIKPTGYLPELYSSAYKTLATSVLGCLIWVAAAFLI